MSEPTFSVGESVLILKKNTLSLYGTYGVIERVTPSIQSSRFWDVEWVYDVAIDDYDYLLTYRDFELLRKQRPSFGRWVKENKL